MRRLMLVISTAFTFAALAAPVRAQGVVRFYGADARAYAPPGLYGMAYGFPAYGVPRTYTEFSSPYGMGYGYGYPPATVLSGRYGVGLWRPGFIAPGYIY